MREGKRIRVLATRQTVSNIIEFAFDVYDAHVKIVSGCNEQ
jgi:hypothetical protein